MTVAINRDKAKALMNYAQGLNNHGFSDGQIIDVAGYAYFA